MNSVEIDELIEVENYLLAKSAEKLGTPVKMELDKLRQVAEERAANCNKGLASVLGITSSGNISNNTHSSPLSRSSSSVESSNLQCPMSAVSFRPGMSVYRPAGSSVSSINTSSSTTVTLDHCPPTPSFIDGKRSRLSDVLDRENSLNGDNNLTARFNETLLANNSPKTIPFSPARAQGLNLIEREACPKKLASRQKQIDYGKNTTGYSMYTSQIPRNQRKRGDHPWTPNKYQLCSKRSWDGQVRKWRRALHKFDPDGECDSVDSESVNSAESDQQQ